MPEIVVFAGPSWPARLRAADQELPRRCEVRPPARRGDVLAALSDDPRTLVLLDGYYYDALAVGHQELLYALDAGVRVIGAASLGALRAVELAPFGMEGAGRVYAWYRDGAIEGDDEVAILHLPADHGYRPVTTALVEVRAALERLAARSPLPVRGCRRLVGRLRRLAFLERRPEVVEALARACLGEAAALALERELELASVKEEDARLALRRALETEPSPAARTRSQTTFLSQHRERYLRPSRRGGRPTPYQRALHAVQAFHPDAAAFVRSWRSRQLLVAAAERAGLAPAAGRVAALADRLRHHLAAQFGGPALPQPEIVEEARHHAMAEAACTELGGFEPALAGLGRLLGLRAGRAEEDLERLAASGTLPLPAWGLVRSLLFTEAAAPALAAAEACDEVHGCFLRWSRGAIVPAADLRALAARLWGCPASRVDSEAGCRGFPPPTGPSESFEAVMAWVAPAEALSRPINDYPERREGLRSSPLAPVLGAPWPPIARDAAAPALVA
jgi:hypothetical protein